MSLLLLLALVAGALYAWRRYNDRPGPGPGASAAARARQLRTPLVRLADLLGIDTQAGRLARRYEAGAEGERRAAARLEDLARDGWTILYDRALPRSRANVDALAISPTGATFLLDPKKWTGRFPLSIRAGRLWHGKVDVTDRLDGVLHERDTVARLLDVTVTPIVSMEGPQLVGPHGRPATQLEFRGIRIVPADRLPAVLRASGRIPGQRRASALVATAARVLPHYPRGL
ncbi:NERD domain-containing protein [Streptomyces sp. NPDC000341]|uniref:nuclease-related domain-containing protein n=1 Tax=Streptomyces sp. NPDC000341 TaxID=3156645 RepID=UPI00332C4EEB